MSCDQKVPKCYRNKKNLDLLHKLKGKKLSTCANCVKKLDGSQSSFLFRSFSDLVRQKEPFRLSNKKRQILQKKISPFGSIVKPFVNPRTSNSVREKLMRKKVKYQTGEGVISLIVAAVIPLIADLISKAVKK